MTTKIDINIENVEKLGEKRTSNQVLIHAIKELNPRKLGLKRTLFLLIISLFPSLIIAISENTIILFVEYSELINTVILTLFGIVFTGYVFFQALVNDDLLIRMINSSGNTGKSKFQENNEYFLDVMILYILGIVINVFLIIFFKVLPIDFCLFNKHQINNTFAFILIYLYMMFTLNMIWEIKCLVFNVYQIFNGHACSKIVSKLKEGKK